MNYILSIVIGYLFGCVNASYLISKMKGVDIKKEGTGNAGAGNVGYVLGVKYAFLVGTMDILKAVIAYKLCEGLFNDALFGQIAGAMAVIGHNHPFYMHFNGGKGFASFMGLLAAYNFWLALILLGIHLIAIFTTKHMVWGSFAVIFFSIVFVLFLKDFQFAIVLGLTIACMLPRHAPNIRCLLNGTEPKLSDAKK